MCQMCFYWAVHVQELYLHIMCAIVLTNCTYMYRIKDLSNIASI